MIGIARIMGLMRGLSALFFFRNIAVTRCFSYIIIIECEAVLRGRSTYPWFHMKAEENDDGAV